MNIGDYMTCDYLNAYGVELNQSLITMTMSPNGISSVRGKIIEITDNHLILEYCTKSKYRYIYTLTIDKIIKPTILDEMQYKLTYE